MVGAAAAGGVFGCAAATADELGDTAAETTSSVAGVRPAPVCLSSRSSNRCKYASSMEWPRRAIPKPMVSMALTYLPRRHNSGRHPAAQRDYPPNLGQEPTASTAKRRKIAARAARAVRFSVNICKCTGCCHTHPGSALVSPVPNFTLPIFFKGISPSLTSPIPPGAASRRRSRAGFGLPDKKPHPLQLRRTLYAPPIATANDASILDMRQRSCAVVRQICREFRSKRSGPPRHAIRPGSTRFNSRPGDAFRVVAAAGMF